MAQYNPMQDDRLVSRLMKLYNVPANICEDVRQQAYLFMLKYHDKYDPTKSKWSSYIGNCITFAMNDVIRRNNIFGSPRAGMHLYHLRRAEDAVAATNPSGGSDEIYEEMNRVYPISRKLFDRVRGGSCSDKVELLRSNEDSTEYIASVHDDFSILQPAIDSLPARERMIVFYRVVDGMTFKQIGKKLNLSWQRVSFLYRRSIESLRKRTCHKITV